MADFFMGPTTLTLFYLLYLEHFIPYLYHKSFVHHTIISYIQFFSYFNCFYVLNISLDCSSPPETGPCKAAFPRYYYDKYDNSCKYFIFGGCEVQGNKNNYETPEECMTACGRIYNGILGKELIKISLLRF